MWEMNRSLDLDQEIHGKQHQETQISKYNGTYQLTNH